MLVNVVINTRKNINLNKIYDYIYANFGADSLICCPIINFRIEGNPLITIEHKNIVSLYASEAIVYIYSSYHDGTPINRIIRSLELKNNNVYNLIYKELI